MLAMKLSNMKPIELLNRTRVGRAGRILKLGKRSRASVDRMSDINRRSGGQIDEKPSPLRIFEALRFSDLANKRNILSPHASHRVQEFLESHRLIPKSAFFDRASVKPGSSIHIVRRIIQIEDHLVVSTKFVSRLLPELNAD